MKKFDITEEMLKNKVTIETPEQPLCWEYHEYIVKNPILSWNVVTYMLRGENDILCEADEVLKFSEKSGCCLEIQKDGEHHFHTHMNSAAFLKTGLKKNF